MIKNIIKENHLLNVKNSSDKDVFIIWIKRIIPKDIGWFIIGIKFII